MKNRSLWGLIIFNTTKSEDMKVNIKIVDPITCFYIFSITFYYFFFVFPYPYTQQPKYILRVDKKIHFKKIH